jgi:cellulose synthase/poly-beta-1,6-N-acetylglucosamine synthase-like glycosyltransferase
MSVWWWHLLIWPWLLPLVLASVVFSWQAWSCRLRRDADTTGDGAVDGTAQAPRGHLAVLVPAHNEADGIEETLRGLLAQLQPGDRLLVVADNCSDDTAERARRAGAEVSERQDSVRRGKGFALAHGVDVLRQAPPQVVVIVDADCQLADGALDALGRTAERLVRPVQGLYLMLGHEGDGLGRRFAEFAWRIRNLVRPSGWQRWGLPCQLMGSGMAFPWDLVTQAPLASSSIVEDLKLGLDMAMRGAPPVFCPQALVTSHFPLADAATRSQRTRWEHGHMETLLREAPPMLAAALRRRDLPLAALALDLLVPPLALLALVLGAAWLFLLGALALGGPALAAGVAGLALLAYLGAVLRCWWLVGRDLVQARELLMIPRLMLSKFSIYRDFLVRRQKDWVRTDRRP